MANGVAYGFYNLQDMFAERVTNVEPEVIDTAIQQSAAQYDQDLNAMLSLLATRHEGYPKLRFELGGEGELQPLAQNGTPIPTRTGARYEVALPMWRGGDSFGANREAWAKMTVGQMNSKMLNVQIKDAKWNMRRLLAAIYTNVNVTYNDDNDTIGALTIKPLANNDTDKYVNLAGDLAVAQHYTAQASAIDNSNNPYLVNYNLLAEQDANAGPYVSYIPADLVATTMALSAFNENPNLSPFVDFGVNETQASEAVEDYLGFGNRVLGEVSGSIVVESRRLPAGYVLTIDVSQPFMRYREEPEPELQGLQMVTQQVDSNFRKIDFYRKRGYAVVRRPGAAVRRIGNGSYAIPTGYNLATLAG